MLTSLGATAMPETAEADPAMPVPEASGEGSESLATAVPAPETPPVRILTPDSDTADTSRPAIGTPAVSLVDRGGSDSRLPTIGEAAPDATDTDMATATTTDKGADAPPLVRYAQPVDVAPDLPRLAIVLIDDGSGPLGPDALDAFPFPVTFALDPAMPGAAARMQGYREQGFEVMALAGVPDGAQPTDVEVTLEAVLAALPETVAVLENPAQGLQGTREISDQVAQVMLATGHGLVLQPKGLNTAAALAQREGVPSASVFKDFDGEGQDTRAIRRFLDGAAFRARQDGGVVAMGRLKADTLSALLLWGLQDRAQQVALVPVSMVLR